jgi:hypothetical protein
MDSPFAPRRAVSVKHPQPAGRRRGSDCISLHAVKGTPGGQSHNNAVRAYYVLVGGGYARLLKALPPGTHPGDNSNAFRGGYRLWTKLYGGSAHNRFVH